MPDSLRWVRVASDGRYGPAGGYGLRIQTADDRWHRYASRVDTLNREIVLSPFNAGGVSLRVRYAKEAERLTLTTTVAGDSVTAHLRPIDVSQYAMFKAW